MKLELNVSDERSLHTSLERLRSSQVSDDEADEVLVMAQHRRGEEPPPLSPVFTQLSLSPLVKLTIWTNFGFCDVNPISAQILAAAIQACRGTLQTFTSFTLGLTGNLEELSNALHEHPSLKKVGLNGLYQTDGDDWSWDSLVSSLGTCLQLQNVAIDFTADRRRRFHLGSVGPGLDDLCSSRTIEALAITGAPVLCNSHYESMFQALGRNQCLKSLTVSHASGLLASCFGVPPTVHVGTMLTSNITLESLKLGLQHPVPVALQPILDALASHNRSLRTLTLALCRTRIMVQGRLQQVTWQRGTDGSFAEMLQENTLLEELSLDQWPSGVHPLNADTSFFLDLNQSGRRHFLLNDNGATREDWIQEILQNHTNVPLVFYYLTRNLSILDDCTVKRRVATLASDHRKKRRKC